jgi:glycosyltransferase involved in cell wall biosynthesis
MLNSCDLFVLPSKWEGMPKALVEAMACGLPVIGTDVPGIRDLIDHGRNGYLCEPGERGIRSAIASLIEDPQVGARLGQEARKFAASRFSLENIASIELELLAEICEQ